jgi:hypothetical protein
MGRHHVVVHMGNDGTATAQSEHAHEPCAPALPHEVRRQQRIGELRKTRGVGEVARQTIDVEIADKLRHGDRLVELSDARLPIKNRDLAAGESLVEVNKVARPSVKHCRRSPAQAPERPSAATSTVVAAVTCST